MAAITFKNLENPRKLFKPSQAELYTDISLDFGINENTKDLKVSLDTRAIVNSVYNLLTTRPGQNFLFPRYGLDVSRHLFESISEFNGQILGEEIVNTIQRFEPRVSVLNANVGVNIDKQEYNITLMLYIPSLGTQISFNPIFTSDGAYYLGNNQYE
jgi:phage baseplate assembly protein W